MCGNDWSASGSSWRVDDLSQRKWCSGLRRKQATAKCSNRLIPTHRDASLEGQSPSPCVAGARGSRSCVQTTSTGKGSDPREKGSETSSSGGTRVQGRQPRPKEHNSPFGVTIISCNVLNFIPNPCTRATSKPSRRPTATVLTNLAASSGWVMLVGLGDKHSPGSYDVITSGKPTAGRD